MTTLLKTTLRRPIDSLQDLVDYLVRGARPQSQWGIGIELENLVMDAVTGEAADYTDTLPLQCLHPVGHFFEIPNLLLNGTLARGPGRRTSSVC